MNWPSKFFTVMFIATSINACGTADDTNNTETNAQKKSCIENQKQALKNAGVLVWGDDRDLKKLAEMGPDFYKTIPYCSE